MNGSTYTERSIATVKREPLHSSNLPRSLDNCVLKILNLKPSKNLRQNHSTHKPYDGGCLCQPQPMLDHNWPRISG